MFWKKGFSWGGILLLLMLCTCRDFVERENRLTIATAANLQFVIPELVEAFFQKTNIECEIIIGSSGKLTAQIREGAPFDVFLSADMKYPNDLFEKGLTADAPQIYGYGKIVLWTLDDQLLPSENILTNEKIKHIALANPKTAPYGKSAIELLQSFKIFDEVEKKLVYGESISQTTQFIASGAADIGFAALSVVLSPKMKNKGKWKLMDATQHTPIAQGIVLLRNDEAKQADAQKFRNFLFSKKGKKILEEFGYGVVE